MYKNLKIILYVLLPFVLVACDFGQRQAQQIFSLSAMPSDDVSKTQKFENSTNSENENKLDLMKLDRNEAVSIILSQNSIVYSDIVEVIEYHDDPSLTAEIISGMLLKSDRVCKRYLFNIIDLRNGYKITNQALNTLPTILTVFGLPGTEIVTIGRINSVQEGVASSLTDIGIDQVSLLNNLKDIQSVRKKMRNAIHKAFSQNIENQYVGVGPSSNSEQAYTVFSALLDLETYHETCSLYEKIYFNFDVPEKLNQLNAFRLLNPEKQNVVTNN